MRRLLCLSLVLVACGGGETATTDSAAADSAAAAPAATLTVQDLAGTFTGSSYREGSDTATSTWTQVVTVGADNSVNAKVVFGGSTDSIPQRLVAIEGDSVRWEIGPYRLGGRADGPEVNTVVVTRRSGDGFAGTFEARPVASPDSVIRGRLESRRVP